MVKENSDTCKNKINHLLRRRVVFHFSLGLHFSSNKFRLPCNISHHNCNFNCNTMHRTKTGGVTFHLAKFFIVCHFSGSQKKRRELSWFYKGNGIVLKIDFSLLNRQWPLFALDNVRYMRCKYWETHTMEKSRDRRWWWRWWQYGDSSHGTIIKVFFWWFQV